MANETSYIDAWYDLMDNRSDPRVKDWFLMGSVFPSILCVLVYVYFVKVFGPKFMEKRKPYDLNNSMLAYNFMQVLISAGLFIEGMRAGWARYSLICEPVDYSNTPEGIRMAWICYLYYLSKFTELIDTVFFVLRKKNNQISILHVAHHALMPVCCWFGVKFVPGGHGTFFGLLNSFVHIWMYLYYLLAALGPRVQPYLWWKKYLTSMQIIQFVLVICQNTPIFFIECNYPKICSAFIMLHGFFFLIMFSNFYGKTYKSTGKKASEFNVAELEVDPHREGIKQSELWAKNYENVIKKRRANEGKRD